MLRASNSPTPLQEDVTGPHKLSLTPTAASQGRTAPSVPDKRRPAPLRLGQAPSVAHSGGRDLVSFHTARLVEDDSKPGFCDVGTVNLVGSAFLRLPGMPL